MLTLDFKWIQNVRSSLNQNFNTDDVTFSTYTARQAMCANTRCMLWFIENVNIDVFLTTKKKSFRRGTINIIGYAQPLTGTTTTPPAPDNQHPCAGKFGYDDTSLPFVLLKHNNSHSPLYVSCGNQ